MKSTNASDLSIENKNHLYYYILDAKTQNIHQISMDLNLREEVVRWLLQELKQEDAFQNHIKKI